MLMPKKSLKITFILMAILSIKLKMDVMYPDYSYNFNQDDTIKLFADLAIFFY
jgi:hypothetical protein